MAVATAKSFMNGQSVRIKTLEELQELGIKVENGIVLSGPIGMPEEWCGEPTEIASVSKTLSGTIYYIKVPGSNLETRSVDIIVLEHTD